MSLWVILEADPLEGRHGEVGAGESALPGPPNGPDWFPFLEPWSLGALHRTSEHHCATSSLLTLLSLPLLGSSDTGQADRCKMPVME